MRLGRALVLVALAVAAAGAAWAQGGADEKRRGRARILYPAVLVPEVLREPVRALDRRRADFRDHRLELKGPVSVLVLDPIMMASIFLQPPGKLWADKYRPRDYSTFDFTARAVTIQVEIGLTFGEAVLQSVNYVAPNSVQVELLRDGVAHASSEPRRRPLHVGPHFDWNNPGVAAFAPELFAPGGVVELRLIDRRSGAVIGTLPVPEALRARLAADFALYDAQSPPGGYVSPVVANPFAR